MHLPYYNLSLAQALAAALVSTVLLSGSVAAVGFGLAMAGYWIFERFGSPARQTTFWSALTEPTVIFIAILAVAVVAYPGLTSVGLLRILGPLPVGWIAVALSIAVAIAIARLGGQARRPRLMTVSVVLVALGATGAPTTATALSARSGLRPDILLLGLDSIAQKDDIDILRQWAIRMGGAWYTNAVAPGLLTNAVWASILTGRPVSEHGVFHTFQSLSGVSSPLLRGAADRGLLTVAAFPDQMTSWVGEDTAFDRRISGPVGWRQLVLPLLENASVVLPLLQPLRPRWEWLAVPPNHAGTYTYSVVREIREILRSGAGPPTLTASHLTYLHLPTYPASWELSVEELTRVWRTPAALVRDRTFDWQDREMPADPVPLHEWKRRHLQRVVSREITASRFIEHGGRLIIFSDHGDRYGLTLENFSDPRYWNILLVTFGVPASVPANPISLTELAGLIGFAPAASSPPAVEYAIAPPELWPRIVETARPEWSGRVSLNQMLMESVGANLRRYAPSGLPD